MASIQQPRSAAQLTWPEIDRALAEWRRLLQVIDDNLCELGEHPTLRKLEGRPGEPATPLEGDTLTRVEPALRAVREVWVHRDRLSEVIDQSTELQKSVRPWSEARQAAQIDALLNGPSIDAWTCASRGNGSEAARDFERGRAVIHVRGEACCRADSGGRPDRQ